MKSMKTLAGLALSVVTAVTLSAMSTAAQQTVYVTPDNQQGWSTADTRPGGNVEFIQDNTLANGGVGVLNLTTTNDPAAKAQYMRAESIPLDDLTEVSYWTKQNGGPAFAAPAFNIPVCLGGFTTPTSTNPTGCVGFTTLVYEPYQNGTVVPNTWQQWDVDAGQLWSTRNYSSGTCMVTAGGGGAPFYTLSTLAATCPDAVVAGYGVNIGTNNPGYDVSTDLIKINNTTYNFEPWLVPTNKDQCKNYGWRIYRQADGTPFRNQGQCVAYVNHNSQNSSM